MTPSKFSNAPQFTEKEEQVFEGIIRHPHLNDTELSKKININRTTITCIRNKLLTSSLYSPARIPKLCIDKSELLTIVCIRLNPFEASRAKTKEIDALFDTPQMIFGIASQDKLLAIFLSKDYTELYNTESLNSLNDAQYVSETIYHTFPIQSLHVPVFFEYAPLFRSSGKTGKQNNNPSATGTASLFESRTHADTTNMPRRHTAPSIVKVTPTEKIIMYALVKHPSWTDNQTAEFTNMHRSRITQVRNKLTKSGLIRTLNIPDAKKLNHTCLRMTHIKFNTHTGISKITKIIKSTQDHLKSIFISYNTKEAIILSSSETHDDSMLRHRKFFEYCTTNKLPVKSITSYPYCTVHSKMKQLDFVPLLRDMLCYKENY